MAKLNSRRKLKPRDAERFADAEPWLFRELARVICKTGVLPEKELHECWQMAERVHQAFPEVRHVADIAAGHGLLGWILVLMAHKAEEPIRRTAVAIDITRPPSADTLARALKENWPELEGQMHFIEGSIDAVRASNGSETLFVAAHACGSLSDRVLISAMASGSSVAFMPCCHSYSGQQETLSSIASLSGLSTEVILPEVDSIDDFREQALRQLHYLVSRAGIDPEISTFNRIIIGKAPSVPSPIRSLLPRDPSPLKRSGEIRAYETIPLLDVSDLSLAQQLADRPSREWRRVFDLSFWIADDREGELLLEELQLLLSELDYTVNVKVLGRFLHPATQRWSQTVRMELLSTTIPITKDLALSLRSHICSAMDGKFVLRM